MKNRSEPPPRYKTVSIPEAAYERLFALREMVSRPGVELPEHAQRFLGEQMAGGVQKYTFGTVFWLACEMAIQTISKNGDDDGDV